MKDVDSVVQSVVGCKAVLTHLVFSGLRNDEEEEELVSDAACKHIASFSKLQHLAILSLEGEIKGRHLEGGAPLVLISVSRRESSRDDEVCGKDAKPSTFGDQLGKWRVVSASQLHIS